MNFKELLPKRIPEYLQDDNGLKDYLEVAGELFDAFNENIIDFDHYQDPAKVTESRLKELAAKFAMEFPRNLNSELQRSIIRDLEAVYQKSGTIDVIHWIFRIIGWDVKIENAWVLNPEYYDPNIKVNFELDDYGKEQTLPTITDFYSRNYKAFLIGEDYTDEGGTYFKGKHLFDLEQTVDRYEIIGEYYDLKTKTRTPNKVMKTPYLFIRVSDETYNIFISPYTDEDTGITYDYTEAEFFKVVENMFNFFLFDALRPTNVRVVVIVAPQNIDDTAVVEDSYADTWTSDPINTDDEGVVSDFEGSYVVHETVASPEMLAGMPASPYNKDMSISAISFRNMTGYNSNGEVVYYVNDQGNYYTVVQDEDYPVVRCGGEKWKFITPDEHEYFFRVVFLSEDTTIDPTGSVVTKPYADDLDSLSLSFDLSSNSYGIIDKSGSVPIIIRNPTTLDSYILNPLTIPANVYYIGGLDNDNPDIEFDTNKILSLDAREYGVIEADTTNKNFYYLYDISISHKENNAQPNWVPLITNPKKGDMVRLSDSNSLAFIFNNKIPYDFILDVTYHSQPKWDNRY